MLAKVKLSEVKLEPRAIPVDKPPMTELIETTFELRATPVDKPAVVELLEDTLELTAILVVKPTTVEVTEVTLDFTLMLVVRAPDLVTPAVITELKDATGLPPLRDILSLSPCSFNPVLGYAAVANSAAVVQPRDTEAARAIIAIEVLNPFRQVVGLVRRGYTPFHNDFAGPRSVGTPNLSMDERCQT